MPAFEPFEQRNVIAFQAKRRLRKQMQRVREAISGPVLCRSAEVIQRRVLQLPAWIEARTLALCAVPPKSRGVHTSMLASSARARGKTVVYPRVDFETQRVEFRCASEDELEVRGLETAEAPACATPISTDAIDLIIVPVLAVDPYGVFIGDGSGAYDNVMALMPQATTLALAFEFQLIPEAPRTSDDVPVAVIVTEKRVLEARGERSDEELMSRTDRAAKEVRRGKQPDPLADSVDCTGSVSNWARGHFGQSP